MPGSSCGPAQTLTEDDVKAFCKDQIAHYKIPRHVRFVEDFPMTVTGKMQKYLMRATMADELEHAVGGRI